MATITSGGRYPQILNLTLSATDDIQIGFTECVNSVIIKCRTSVDLQLRTTRQATNYLTIPAGMAFTIDIVGNINSVGTVLPLDLWLRSTSGSVVAEILGVYGG